MRSRFRALSPMPCAAEMARTGPPADWPLAECSRMVMARPHHWHVQITGTGPVLLFLHGAGGTTHSWRDVLPAIPGFTCIAIDLPGHGYTRLGSRQRSSLECMAQDLHHLCDQEGWQVRGIVGHSAGGAIALRLSRMLPDEPPVVAINPALQPFDGLAGLSFQPPRGRLPPCPSPSISSTRHLLRPAVLGSFWMEQARKSMMPVPRSMPVSWAIAPISKVRF